MSAEISNLLVNIKITSEILRRLIMEQVDGRFSTKIKREYSFCTTKCIAVTHNTFYQENTGFLVGRGNQMIKNVLCGAQTLAKLKNIV